MVWYFLHIRDMLPSSWWQHVCCVVVIWQCVVMQLPSPVTVTRFSLDVTLSLPSWLGKWCSAETSGKDAFLDKEYWVWLREGSLTMTAAVVADIPRGWWETLNTPLLLGRLITTFTGGPYNDDDLLFWP